MDYHEWQDIVTLFGQPKNKDIFPITVVMFLNYLGQKGTLLWGSNSPNFHFVSFLSEDRHLKERIYTQVNCSFKSIL